MRGSVAVVIAVRKKTVLFSVDHINDAVYINDIVLEASEMAENSAIEWTDHTFNPWEGCQKVGPGCDHCYAETRNARFGGGTAPNWGPGAPRRRTSVSNWRKPLAWQKDAVAFRFLHDRRQRVFCASLADVFDNAVDAAWRTDLFELIRATPDLDWLLLTKRIGNVAAMARAAGGLPGNVWLGATIVNQEEADRDVPKLLAIDAQVRFLSMEPLLGPVDLTEVSDDSTALNPECWGDCACSTLYGFDAGCRRHGGDGMLTRKIDWIIVGGESGPGARPMHPSWARGLREQCAEAGVPMLFKQWGEWAPAHSAPSGTAGAYAIACSPSHTGQPVFPVDAYPRMIDLFGGSSVMQRVGKKVAGRLLDGAQHDGFPSSPSGTCFLCAGKCRGHGLADPVAWEPEVGSVAALARAKAGAARA